MLSRQQRGRAGDEQRAASRLHDHVRAQGERVSDMVPGLAELQRSAVALHRPQW
jgi:hypothetical protein